MEIWNYYYPQSDQDFACTDMQSKEPDTYIAVSDGETTIGQTFHHHSMAGKKNFLESIITAAEEELDRIKGFDAKTGKYEPQHPDRTDQLLEGDGWRTAYNTGSSKLIYGEPPIKWIHEDGTS